MISRGLRVALLAALSCALLSCSNLMEPEPAALYDGWLAKGSNKGQVKALSTFLEQEGAANIIPLAQLLRSDTNWQRCKAEPFAVPPRAYWPNMVSTLKLVRAEIIPLVGTVEAQSVFRDPAINRCIKGASRSFHLRFHAIDMKPATAVTREQLVAKLCPLHLKKGAKLNMGLGIYSGTRFHVDAAGYRGWGDDHRGKTFPCHNVAPQRNLG